MKMFHNQHVSDKWHVLSFFVVFYVPPIASYGYMWHGFISSVVRRFSIFLALLGVGLEL